MALGAGRDWLGLGGMGKHATLHEFVRRVLFGFAGILVLGGINSIPVHAENPEIAALTQRRQANDIGTASTALSP